MRPIQAILALEDIADSLRCPLCRKGIRLSLEDRQTVVDVYSQWICILLDLGYLHSSSFIRVSRRLLTDMLARDVYDLNVAFTELLDTVRYQDFRGFKGLCVRISTHFYSIVKSDMLRTRDSDVFAAGRLVQLFSYTSRLSLQDINLSQQCLDDYMESERLIDDRYPSDLIDSLREIVSEWMEPFDPVDLKFRHGSGGVADTPMATLADKYNYLETNRVIDCVFGDSYLLSTSVRSKFNRTSRTMFVPKSFKTFRTISLEPATLMYLQQGVWGEIDRVVSSSRYLKSHIGFHDQTRNQRLARIGSISRTYATIDLSAASDSVSYGLVKMMFKETKLLPYLRATRSTRTLLPNKFEIKLKKFAPMGSRLCFPIETLIFASICEFVTRRHDVSGDYSVYGDDIVVPTSCVGDLVNVLLHLGFRVNHSKSFSRSDIWFRESCGAEYCAGHDVTPVRVSRKYSSQIPDVRATKLLKLANDAYGRNLMTLRSFALRKFTKYGYKPLFGPTHVQSEEYTNFHLKTRWCRPLQRFEVKATAFLPKVFRGDEDLCYLHWLEEADKRSPLIDSPRYRVGNRHWLVTPPLLGECFQPNVGRTIVRNKERWFGKPEHVLDQDVFSDLLPTVRTNSRPD